MSDIEKVTALMNRIQEIALELEAIPQRAYMLRAQFSLQNALQELFHGMAADAPQEVADV